ncbi:hypothetical protein CCACVL1_13471 [Corchorus capsularis]|uniref:Uncharacterized protein n=1 Tax=Corchorus capsularis TaxID=210143 RepID=A0A1R3IAW5_COCAP|nr:hypothetical protein CCACVL1_13471 [Corchorus capsularis]
MSPVKGASLAKAVTDYSDVGNDT